MGADFTTTYLTTFRTGLPGDSSTTRTLYQFFRTKKHVLDDISRKKPYPFAWGSRGRKFKSCHSDPNRAKIGYDHMFDHICHEKAIFHKGFRHFAIFILCKMTAVLCFENRRFKFFSWLFLCIMHINFQVNIRNLSANNPQSLFARMGFIVIIKSVTVSASKTRFFK